MLCVAGLILLNFGQTANAATERVVSAADLAFYVLPDGTLPEICITIPGGSGEGKIIQITPDLAQAQPGFALPPVAASFGPSVISPHDGPPTVEAVVLQYVLYSPGAGPRAPPVFVSS